MTSDNQDSVEQHWRENARDDIAQSEEENWRESGQALNDAKQAVADQYNVQSQWANNAIDKVRAAHDGKLPFDNEGILQAVSVEYDPRRGDGRDDPEFTLTENDLPPAVKEAGVSDELWSEIEEALLDSFNGRADDKANEMDPPDNLVDDALDSYWEEMRSRDKFSYAEEHGLIEDIEDESSDDDGEPLDLNPTQETLVRKLLDNDDPKAIWALSDTAAGKQLLLGSDWNGAIDFHDKETMANSMPTSESKRPVPNKPQPEAEEFFYRDKGGKRQDASLHESILGEGDNAAARAISDKVLRRLGFSDDDIEALHGPTPKQKKRRAQNLLSKATPEGEHEHETEQTEIELWPEEGEKRSEFMDRCTVELEKCIGDRAEDVCDEKWHQSRKLGKKGFGKFLLRAAPGSNLAIKFLWRDVRVRRRQGIRSLRTA